MTGSILKMIRDCLTRLIEKTILGIFDVSPSSPIRTLLEKSQLIGYFGGVGGVISLWIMGYIVDGFKCILVFLLGNVLYYIAYYVARFLFIDTLSSGKIDEPISSLQVVAVAGWQLYYMIVLIFWCDITIWGYLGDIECIQSMALRLTYLAIGISIPGLSILRQSRALRQKAVEGSKLALGMAAEFDVAFIAHVLACYAAYTGERKIVVLCIVPLLQIIAFVILIPGFKEQAEGVVRSLRMGRTNAMLKGTNDNKSESLVRDGPL